MYRRRRPSREKIVFSFDSFLDVVANVNGIIIRLILVAWVGARAYHEGMRYAEPTADPANVVALAPPKADDDQLSVELARRRDELATARKQLADKLGAAQEHKNKLDAVAGQLTSLTKSRESLSRQVEEVGATASEKAKLTESTALSLGELRKRGDALKSLIASVEAQPPPSKQLRYHTPVSKTVTTDEIFFECSSGRVTYLDMPGFFKEIEGSMPGREDQLRVQFRVEDMTPTIGAFRVKYTVERSKSSAETIADAARPRNRLYFGYSLGGFQVEPLSPIRGEAQEKALLPTSDFRQIVDGIDGQTVVTFWVYPDSFPLFRVLRDYLHDRGIQVAARPLPVGEPIRGSPSGSRSRGQ